MKPLFLNPPTFEDFDGGAGARYQASREVTSFWYPTWLCFPAGMIEGSRVVDAPVQKFTLDDCLKIAKDFDMVVMYTSTPTLPIDIETARRIKEVKPGIVTVLTGPHVTILPEESLKAGKGAIDIVCRGEFDYSTKELCEGRDWDRVDGISFLKDGTVVHTPDRAPIADLDALPFVAPIYKRDLPIREYVIPHFKNPYVSIYSSRGCPSRCIYCLWPQTFSGRQMRTRSPQNVCEEIKWIVDNIPEMRELSFDDDTFSADRKHARAVAELIKPLGISWTINARANCDYETLKVMREAGLRHVVVGYETGNEQILKEYQKRGQQGTGDPVHQGLPEAGALHPRRLHNGLAGRDQGNHPRDHRIRQNAGPQLYSGLAGLTLSRHRILRPVQGAGLDLLGRLYRRYRPPEVRDQLPAPLQCRDIQLRGRVLQQVLLPPEIHPAQHRQDDRQRRGT